MSGGEADYVIFLLQTLKEEWDKHRSLKSGASRELKQLQTGLHYLETFLRDVDKISEKSDLFEQKKSQIREFVYDVQDTIELYLTTIAASKSRNFVSRFCRNISTEMEKRVKQLREQMQPILKDIEDKFGKSQVNNRSSRGLKKQLPEVEINETKGQPSSSEEDPKDIDLPHKVVDFQDEETILKYLLKSEVTTLDVIAITGPPGLGKTTFARKIYENEAVVAQFPLRIWVHVSENFNSIDTFREIWNSLTVKETFVRDVDLIDSVRRSLERRNEFLIVTDDVWRKEDWEVIRKIFPTNNGTRKVLVTTREREVAELCGGFKLPLELKGLEEKKSLELLKFQVFDELKQFDEELEKIGKDIAKKCRGVPLVILVIGGILKKLYFEDGRVIPDIKEKWAQVSKNMDKFLGNDLILDAVELSYKRLSHDLRLCFLYTGLFPENHEIPASTLTQLWIAEGFVAWKAGQSAQEKADTILKTLIRMNLVMVVEKKLEQVKTCCVHDMIRVFCRTKAKNENFFTVIERPSEPLPLDAKVDLRRLCFGTDPSNFFKNNLNSVRSFLWFSKGPVVDSKQTVPYVSNLLRVLNCTSIKFQQFPEVKRLMLLKHVTLYVENLKSLPEDISQLVNLQTLIVGTDSGFITVKANIWKMVRLRRLKTKAAILLGGKNWKGKHSGNLLTITRLSPESCKAALSERAPDLKTLGVRGKLANVGTTMDMETFTKVENLKLVNELADKSNPSNPMVFTKLNWFPPNLKSLTLSNTCLQWSTHMPLLSMIKTLEVLKLKDNAFSGTNWDIKDGAGFPKLQFLLMEKLGLAYWKVPDTYFPYLRSLVIKKCVELRQIPENLARYIENLEIELVHSSAVASAQIIARKQIMLNQKRAYEVAFKLTIDQVPFSVTINEDSAASSSGQDN